MRCRFCGSRSLHEDKQHKNFSGGKAVAGAVTFGVIGAAAGFIGKDKDGYRCGACGAFMEAPMMYVMEDMVNSAIEKAKTGESRSMYDYYKAQYPNIEDVPQAAVTAPTAAALPSAAADRAFAAAERIEHTAEDGPSPIKRKYFYGYWQPDCPIYIDTIYIRSGPQGDLLALDARNQDSRTIRSAYYQVTAYDDTGDEVSSVRCVYQNINTGCGWALGNDIEFALNTNLAYRVDIACEKIAFENGDVWRAPKTLEALPVTEQTLLTSENFPRLDYARRKLWSKYARHAQTYMPVDHGEYWQCACRMPVKKGGVCHLETHGDKTYGELMEILSQENLRKDQQEAVRKRAADRAEKTIALYQAGAEKLMQANYGKALAQMQMDTVAGMTNAIALFEKYPDYKDTQTRIDTCKAKIPILQEQEKQEKLAAEKKAGEQRAEAARKQAEKEAQEKARKEKNKKAGIVAAIIFVAAIIAVLILTLIIIPNRRYKAAEELLSEGKTAEAAIAFGKLGDYKDAYKRSMDAWDQVAQRKTIAAGSFHTVGLKADGTVITAGNHRKPECQLSDWKDIIAIDAGGSASIGLKSDGTVVGTGQFADLGWSNIVAITTNGGSMLGLKNDGTVVAAGSNYERIIEVSQWKDVVAISLGDYNAFGVTTDGNILITGYDRDNLFRAKNWNEPIVTTSAGIFHVIGLTKDGRVRSAGSNSDGQSEVITWQNIVQIAASDWISVGLKDDGMILHTSRGYTDALDWTNVIAIDVEYDRIVAVLADGTAISTPYSGDEHNYGQCDLSAWTGLKVPGT